MATTQEDIPIQEIRDDVLIMKNGDMVVVLETSAVNFGLLSANEQYAIIAAFAGMLNSLSFMIQICIRSKRLDITDYLKLLDEAYKKQTNPLLGQMMLRYRVFIERTVRENEVLDKQFFIVIPISYLEVSFTRNTDANFKKGLTLLIPRRDHIIRQLSRIGLKANQLDHKKLVELFHDIYNFDPKKPISMQELHPQNQTPETTTSPVAPEILPATPAPTTPPAANPTLPNTNPAQTPAPTSTPMASPTMSNQAYTPVPQNPQNQSQTNPTPPRSSTLSGPFVVEELTDDYSSSGR